MSAEITTYYEELKNEFERKFYDNLRFSNCDECNIFLIKTTICELLDLLDERARR
jgi:hypothetical protein